MILASIRFQEHRYQIGTFQKITKTFGIPPKIVSPQEYLWHVDQVGTNHKSKGPKGRSVGPTPWLAGHTLSRFRPRLGGYAPKAVYKSIQCQKLVETMRSGRPAGHVAGRPTVHHLQTNSIKSVEAQLNLYIRILTVEFRTHHNILVVLHL
jgi:hypothetical protein